MSPYIWQSLLVIIGALALLLVIARRKAANLEAKIETIKQTTAKGLKEAQVLVEQQRTDLQAEESRIRQHYANEGARIQREAADSLTNLRRELESLRKFASLHDAEATTQKLVSDAITEANLLRAEAQLLVDTVKTAVLQERASSAQKTQEIRAQADQLLHRVTQAAAKITEEAHKNAEQIAGDAYLALRESKDIERAVKAIKNVIDGYGDRYIVPTHSVIDELASGYSHTEAGKMLQISREQTKRMVEQGLAATCDYAETSRRDTAIRFVTDAFNGRVDAILTEAEHDNIGTLEQQIRDAFSLVNLNGRAFRDARILPAYLDARLSELKWAVAAYELRRREQEEQRRIKEQIREEEKARREYERAVREAEDEENKLQRALEKARQEVEHSSAQERTKFEAQIATLSLQLIEAEEKNRRAISMAQQTKRGNVYIISNIGSFGEDVFKIGMTRRLDPMDRIWELSDASVPFDFDVHAMIPCDDAPALEAVLHSEFEIHRINKVNYRKEFFRVPLSHIRILLGNRGIDAAFTLLAEAREFRETLKLARLSPADQQSSQLESQAEKIATDTQIDV